jgi:hypothetical protein
MKFSIDNYRKELFHHLIQILKCSYQDENQHNLIVFQKQSQYNHSLNQKDEFDQKDMKEMFHFRTMKFLVE